MKPLLRAIAIQNSLYELQAHEIAIARGFAAKGWVIIKETPMSKSKANYGSRISYALITDAGRRAAAG